VEREGIVCFARLCGKEREWEMNKRGGKTRLKQVKEKKEREIERKKGRCSNFP